MATPLMPSTVDHPSTGVAEPERSQEFELEKPEQAEPEAFQPGWRFIAAFVSLCIITLMSALDATSLSVALPVQTLCQPYDELMLTISQIMARALGGSAIEAFCKFLPFLLYASTNCWVQGVELPSSSHRRSSSPSSAHSHTSSEGRP